MRDEEERSLLGAVLVISMGSEDVSKMKVPEEVGRRLLQCYGSLGQAEED